MRLTSPSSGFRTAAVLLALVASPAAAADLRVGLAAPVRDLVRDTMEDQAIIPLFLYRNAWAVRRPLTYVARADELTLAIDVRR